MWSERRIDGSATFTTVLSSMIMNNPTETAASVHHFLFSGVTRRCSMRSSPSKLARAKLAQLTGRVSRLARVADVVWTPDEATIEHANATRLLAHAGVSSYAELQRRSWEEPEWFWPLCVDDMGLEFSQPWERVLDESRGPAWTTWFLGGRLSIARNCVHRWAERRPDAVAAVGLGEDGSRRETTFAELSHDVARLAER